MDCPKCESKKYVKDGIVKGKQRYLCKKCNYRYTVKRRKYEKTSYEKHRIIKYFLEGNSYRAVGKHFNISHVSVMNIVKEDNTNKGKSSSIPN